MFSRTTAPIFAIAALFGSAPSSAQDSSGTIVGIGGVDVASLADAANDESDVLWSGVALAPETLATAPDFAGILARASEAHVLGDNSQCIQILDAEGLTMSSALEHRARAMAAASQVLRAACWFDHERSRAESALESLFALDIDAAAYLERLPRPDVRSAAEEIRERVQASPRVTLHIQTIPETATITIDADPNICASTPCDIAVLPGEHFIHVRALGYEERFLRLPIHRAQPLDVALAPATREDALAQLSEALAAGEDITSQAFLLAAATAFETRLVMFIDARGNTARGVLFDRRSNTILPHAAARDTPLESLVASIVDEWRGETRRPVRKRWEFWTALIAGSAAIGTVIFFTTRDTRNDLQFF